MEDRLIKSLYIQSCGVAKLCVKDFMIYIYIYIYLVNRMNSFLFIMGFTRNGRLFNCVF